MSTDSSHVSVALGTMCTVTFAVDGSTATAGAGQSCMLDIPGLGPAAVSITRWTLTISGETITSDFTSRPGLRALAAPDLTHVTRGPPTAAHRGQLAASATLAAR